MATNDIQIRAAKLGHHGLASTETIPYNGYRKHPQGNFLIPEQHSVSNKHRITASQPALNSVSSSSFLNGSIVEFRIDRSQVSTLTNAYVRVAITNSTGNNVGLAPTPFWIDRVEILDHTQNILSTLTSQQLFLSLAFLSREEFEQIAGYICMSSSYGVNGITLANGASGVYYIPLYHLFAATKLHLAGLSGELTVRVYTQSSALILTSGSHPTVNNVSLMLKGFNEPNDRRSSRALVYKDARMPLKLPVWNFISHKDIQTLATSSQYTTVLSSIKGTVCGLFITVRASPFVVGTQGSYQALASLDLQLATGESLLGHAVRSHDDMKIEYAELFSNLFGANSNFYFISFSSDPSGDYATGANSGYQVFSGTEKINFTTNSSISPGSFQIDVYALTAQHLDIRNGAIKLLQ